MISDANKRADAIAVAARAYKFHSEPVVCARTRVLPQLQRLAERGNNDVDLAIAVEVRKRAASMRAHNVESGACVRRNIAKLSTPYVGKDTVGLFVRRGFEQVDFIVDV